MNPPIKVWVVTWDNRPPEVYASKARLMEELEADVKAGRLNKEDIEETDDSVYVDDWMGAASVELIR